MHSLIQDILSKIIDSSPFFLKGYVISLAWDSKQNKKGVISCKMLLVRNLQQMTKMVMNVWSLSEVELLQSVAPNLYGVAPGLEAGSR